jgi:lipopolysaccharide transport system ATP-binding protein
MRAAIRVDDVWKLYRIGARTERARTLYEALARNLRHPLRARQRHLAESFWALREIGFEVAPGEVLGVIGPNGAGKSTLLKILSRITGPTRGELELVGRVASLLEVGTGFHPELTGRENIYLNGAVLGMRRGEIARRFDEIVEFAGVERFLDTPVKRYSSGMYLRLAFAVGAHLEPDILLVDEVLAVGDAEFQRKCLDKMSDVSRLGRTVLFVSHNLTAIRRLCPRTLLVSGGRIVEQGETRRVIDAYLAAGIGDRAAWADVHAPGNDRVRLVAVRLRADDEAWRPPTTDEPVTIEIDFVVREHGLPTLAVLLRLEDSRGADVLSSVSTDAASERPLGWYGRPHAPGRYRATCQLPGGLLNDQTYAVSVYLMTYSPPQVEAIATRAVRFEVADSGAMREAEITPEWRGAVRPRLHSTVTLFARLRGWSTSQPRRTPIW